jgi:NAD(P)-dependent dehydrogenase (short-subunit alcohol dehydrogenase family)
MTTPVAFVTGASRGIGKACAVYLARAGFDVAVSARTVHDGERREHSATVAMSDDRPIPGSLSETAACVEAEGRRALTIPADLLDLESMTNAGHTVLDAWGRVDVLVHNGRYVGPGHMDRFLDTPIELLDAPLRANVLGPLALTQVLLPTMLALDASTIVNMTSAAAYADETKPAGEGGWGMSYGVSKGGFHRVAGFLNAEYGDQGLRCFNVQPGVVATERGALDSVQFGFGNWGAPPEVVGAVVAWLATDPLAEEFLGRTVEAQFVCDELGLLPDWVGPTPNPTGLAYDMSGSNLQAIETELSARAQAAERSGSGAS